MKEISKELSNWMGGAIVHSHLRQTFEDQNPYLNQEKHQFTQDAAIKYAQVLTGKTEILITDTNHALLEFWKNPTLLDKVNFIEKNEKKIQYCSDLVLKRALLIKENPELSSLMTGVETDIINEKGELSTTNETLSKLDLVIASFHYRQWGYFNKEPITIEKLLSAYSNLTKNKQVDILGHPTKDLVFVDSNFKVEQFRKILDLMTRNEMAYEINLSIDLSKPESAINREIIKMAVTQNTLFIIGCDFHHFEYYDFLNDTSEIITRNNVKNEFDNNYNTHVNLFRYLYKNIQVLRNLGVRPENILNSKQETFINWLKQKNSNIINN